MYNSGMDVSKLLEQGDLLRSHEYVTRERDLKILEEYARGLSLRQIGEKFKLSHTQISNIIAKFRRQLTTA